MVSDVILSFWVSGNYWCAKLKHSKGVHLIVTKMLEVGKEELVRGAKIAQDQLYLGVQGDPVVSLRPIFGILK